jgi:nucleoside-diphosphate-sugar epimerase
MKPIAILGAAGFVGVRLVETLHLTGVPVRPIVRRPSALATLARFDLDIRLADGTDTAALTAALAGCDTLVDLAFGDPQVIRALADHVYDAASRAGIRRLVYLSSAAVQNQNPGPGTDESSPFPKQFDFPYNAAKAWAETRLRTRRARGAVELTMLRPGLVWGPRDRWVTPFVHALRRREAAWTGGGRAIANTIHVDNLVHAIRQAAEKPVDGEVFFVNDAETLTWREWLSPFIFALGQSVEKIADLPPTGHVHGWSQRLENVRVSAPVQRLAPLVSGVLKRVAKGALGGLREPPAPAALALPSHGPPPLPEEISQLQQCRWHFPNAKAVNKLGYTPPVSFAEGAARTLGWLRFCGLAPAPAA